MSTSPGHETSVRCGSCACCRRGRAASETDPRSGHAAWDAGHLIRGRRRNQIEPFLRRLVRALPEGARVHMSDTVCRIRASSGPTPDDIARFGVTLKHAAVALNWARLVIPLPSEFTDGERSWRALAGRLSTDLDTGLVAVTGTFRGSRAKVATVWSMASEPVDTHVSLAIPQPIPASRRGAFPRDMLAAALDHGAPNSAIGAWPPDAQGPLHRIVSIAQKLSIEEHRIHANMGRAVRETEPAFELLQALHALSLVLHPRSDLPYR